VSTASLTLITVGIKADAIRISYLSRIIGSYYALRIRVYFTFQNLPNVIPVKNRSIIRDSTKLT